MRGALSVATRIWMALRGDRPTLALVFAAPVFIFFLFDVVLDAVPPDRFNVSFMGPVLLGVFTYFLTYLLTSVGFLRERQSGTLERVFASPITRTGLVSGYVIGLGALVVVQAAVILASGVFILGIDFEENVWLFFLAAVVGALSALGLGLLVSLAARNEFQLIQFIPIVLTPQIIFGGVFVPVERLPTWAEILALGMPVTYLLDALEWIVLGQGAAGDFWLAIAVLAGWAAATIGLASFVIRPSS